MVNPALPDSALPDSALPDPALPEIAVAPWSADGNLRITNVRTILTAPEGVTLVVVRIDTSEPGLYGLGCATFTQRADAVRATLDTHLAPILVGRDPRDISELGRLLHLSAYWRSGPVLNNALSGVDQALWDIAGKRLGAPVYELVGGRVRGAAAVYRHASGANLDETLDAAERLIADGTRHIRLQAGGYGSGHYGAPGTPHGYPGHPFPDGWDVHAYLRSVPELFRAARQRLGPEIELLHDVHHRLTPKQAIGLARRLEEYDLFFLEDPIPQEHYDRLPEVRAAAPMPIAVGEQISSVADATRMIGGGGVDVIRLHTSAVGGFTPALRIAGLCELTGVRTAWHGPADVSPIGAAANIALDVVSPAFGVQEGHPYADAARDVFPGTIGIENGYVRPNDAPGWGIDLDERAAAAYPPQNHRFERFASHVRRPDGGLEAP